MIGAFEEPIAVELAMPSDKAFGRSIAVLCLLVFFGLGAVLSGTPEERLDGLLFFASIALGGLTYRRPVPVVATAWAVVTFLNAVLRPHADVSGFLWLFPIVTWGSVSVAKIRRWLRGRAARRERVFESQLAAYDGQEIWRVERHGRNQRGSFL